jgi:hypothetical protein
MIFTLLIFSFIISKIINKSNKNNQNNKFYNTIENFNGFDHRCIEMYDLLYLNKTTVKDKENQIIESSIATLEEIYIFKKRYYQFTLLNKISNNKISELEKIKLIDEYVAYNFDSKYKYNLKAGGLFKDWNWDWDNYCNQTLYN